MKSIKNTIILVVVGLIFSSYAGIAQHKGHGNHNGRNHNKIVVHEKRNGNRIVVRSKYRPNKIVVFHPHWGIKRNFNHRWVYFPRHNFYWDNWRNCYVYRNGNVWLTNTTPPSTVININIDNEKHYELKENEDDVDDVYSTNEEHQKEYKPE